MEIESYEPDFFGFGSEQCQTLFFKLRPKFGKIIMQLDTEEKYEFDNYEKFIAKIAFLDFFVVSQAIERKEDLLNAGCVSKLGIMGTSKGRSPLRPAKESRGYFIPFFTVILCDIKRME